MILDNLAPAVTPPGLPLYERVTGSESRHVVGAGESLGQIAKRFGTRVQLAARMNHLADPERLHLGQQLVLSNRRIVPAQRRDGLVIDLAVLTMYWVRDAAVVATFPVAAGRRTWETPAGHYTIIGRRRDPIWHVPRSIQKEMEAQGQPIKTKVLPGPDNPLGKYWLKLSGHGIGIHGTNAPWSVGRFATHGCIRMRAEHIQRLFEAVPNGTTVDIIDDPIRLARLDDGRILLEAHDKSDPKRTRTTPLAERLVAAGLDEEVDLGRAERVVSDAWGVAVDITRQPSPQAQAVR